MEGNTLVWVIGGLVLLWLVFRLLRSLVKWVVIIGIILFLLWRFEPTRRWLERKVNSPTPQRESLR